MPKGNRKKGIEMNADNYNKALDILALYMGMAVIAEMRTFENTAYISRLSGGMSIFAIVYGKDFDEVCRDVCEVYESKYC